MKKFKENHDITKSIGGETNIDRPFKWMMYE